MNDTVRIFKSNESDISAKNGNRYSKIDHQEKKKRVDDKHSKIEQIRFSRIMKSYKHFDSLPTTNLLGAKVERTNF